MIRFEETETRKIIYDDMNPRIYTEYNKCITCGEWIEGEDTVWIDKNGKATMQGDPYHVECAPPEPDEETDNG